eukprot:3981178-Amphidinium_carterae.1
MVTRRESSTACAHPLERTEVARTDSKGELVGYKALCDAGYVFGASAVAVLWDYMSLPQVKSLCLVENFDM